MDNGAEQDGNTDLDLSGYRNANTITSLSQD